MPEAFPSQQISSFKAILGFNNLEGDIFLIQGVLSQSNFLFLLWELKMFYAEPLVCLSRIVIERTLQLPFNS